MLQDQMRNYQMMDAREHIRKLVRETHKKLLADSLLNRATQLSTQHGVNTQSSLQARDLLKLNPDRAQLGRHANETQARWAARMQKKSKLS